MRQPLDKWTSGSPLVMCRTYPRLLASVLALRIAPEVFRLSRGSYRWGRALTFAVTTLVLYAVVAAVELVVLQWSPHLLMEMYLSSYLLAALKTFIPTLLFNLCLIPLQAAFLVVSVGAIALLCHWRRKRTEGAAVPTGIIVPYCCPALVAPILMPFSLLLVAGVWGHGVLPAYVALGVPFLIQGASAGLLYCRCRQLPALQGLTLGMVAALLICAPLPWYYSAMWKLYMHAVVFVDQHMWML